MTTARLYLRYANRLCGYHLSASPGRLSDLVNLEEGFFHDLKGLYYKRLGLPINRFTEGHPDTRVAEEIKAGAAEAVRLLRLACDQLFSILPPDRRLITIYQTVNHIERESRSPDIAQLVQLLSQLKDHTFAVYESLMKVAYFDPAQLLSDLTSGYEERSAAIGVQVAFKSTSPPSLSATRLPYADFNTWRRILDNLLLNAIEAVEGTGRPGRVEVEVSHGSIGALVLEIRDTGVGMDAETLSRFMERGYTRGKPAGQGLGLTEDVRALIGRYGEFAVASQRGQGTTIRIELHRSSEASKQPAYGSSAPRLRARRLRWAIAVIVLAAAAGGAVALTRTLGQSGERPQGGSDILNGSDAAFWPVLREGPAWGERLEALRFADTLDRDRPLWGAVELLASTGGLIGKLDFREHGLCLDGEAAERRPILADLDDDGKRELVLLAKYYGSDNLPGTSLKDEFVVCFDDQGKRRWLRRLGLEQPRPLFDMSVPQGIKGERLAHAVVRDQGRETSLIFVTGTWSDYPSQFLVFDAQGRRRGEYWNTGHLMGFAILNDINENGTSEVVLSGYNNRLGWSPVVALLEIDSIHGQSPPWLDSLLDSALELDYFVFGHAWGDVDSVYESMKGSLFRLGVGAERLRIDSVGPAAGPTGHRITVEFSDGRQAWFNAGMELDTILVDTVAFGRWWDTVAVGRGFAARPWDSSDIRPLYGYRHYRSGTVVADCLVDPERYDFGYWDRRSTVSAPQARR